MKVFSTQVEVRFADLDLYGHVNHATYFTYMEHARVTAIKPLFLSLTEQGIHLLVAKSSCDYKIPILADDTVIVEFTISRLGKTSFDISYRIHNGNGKYYAEALTTMVSFDAKRKRPVAIPTEFLRFVND